MVSGVEGVGEAVTGGMIARAVEPEAGEASGHEAEGPCRNCGAELTGRYCAACGQKARVHRTIGAFWHDLLHSVLHFEGKIWTTLPMLAWHPGELTRRYIHGERAKFVSPTALFLFSVFLMFAVFSTVGGPIGPLDPRMTPAQQAELSNGLTAEQNRDRLTLDRLEAERALAARQGRDTRTLDAQIASTRQEMRTLARVRDATDGGLNISISERPTRIAWLDYAWRKAKENPELLIYKLQTNAYKFSWALIPISLPLVWLLFLHRRRYREEYGAYDHIVFITYSLAFMTLFAVALSIVQPMLRGPGLGVLAMAVVPPVHMFRQLRGAYQLRKRSALWRTVLLMWFAAIASTLFFLLLVALGAMG
jgi:hypothetical protein